MPKKIGPKELDLSVPLPQSLVSVIEGLSLGSEEQGSDIPYFIDTQCALINFIIGRQGIPAGRLTTIFGKEGGLKSTLAQHILKSTQQLGGIAILNDAERRFSRDRAERIGLDLGNMLFINSRTLEGTFKVLEETVKNIRSRDSKVPITMVIDSLAALPPGKIIEEDMEKSLPALVARFCSMVFPRLIPWFAEQNATLVIINQTRSYLSFDVGPRSYEVRKVMGQKTSMLAEKSLVFWSTVMLEMASAGLLGDKDDPDGIEAKVVVKKNSVGPEGKHCEIQGLFLNGIDNTQAKLALLEQLGIVKQGGGWYEYEPLDKKFRASDFIEVLEARPELEQLVREAPLLWVNGG